MVPTARRCAALALAATLCAAGGAGAQGAADVAADDSGATVMPSTALRQSDYSAPTPLAIPGAQVIDTPALRERLAAERPPLLFDAIGGDGHNTIPGAIWLPGAGGGIGFGDAVQQQLAKTLALATAGDPARALVFFCVNRNCWLSYNAALRAVRLGYREVYWYRGGIQAWHAAGGGIEPPKIVWRRPQ